MPSYPGVPALGRASRCPHHSHARGTPTASHLVSWQVHPQPSRRASWHRVGCRGRQDQHANRGGASVRSPHRRSLAAPIRPPPSLGHREGCPSPWTQAPSRPRGREGHRREDAANQAPRANPLVHAGHGPRGGGRPRHRAPYLEALRPQASPHPVLQALPRPPVRGEARGCGGGVPEPSREERHLQCRREASDPGAGADPGHPPDGGRTGPRDDRTTIVVTGPSTSSPRSTSSTAK